MKQDDEKLIVSENDVPGVSLNGRKPDIAKTLAAM